MTREEAIKSLQNIIEYWTYKPTEVEAAKMAIAALRPRQPGAGRAGVAGVRSLQRRRFSNWRGSVLWTF